MRLRTRLTVVAAAAVAVAIALSSSAAYALARHQLRSQLDTSLRRAETHPAGPRVERLREEISRPLSRTLPAVRGDGGFVQLVNADGTTLHPSDETASLPVGPADLAVAAGTRDAFLRDAHVSGTHVRMITAPLTDGAAIQIGRPLTDIDATLGRLRLALLLVSLGGIALAAGIGLVISRAALQPVTRLTRAAEHIAETQDLGASIDVRGRDEVARLAAAFNEMLAALDGSRQQQRQLVADASHELRTPLTSLRTNLEVLARQRAMPEAERERLLSDVTAQLEELGLLVDDLVELAREDQPPTETELDDLRLDEVVSDAVTRARRHAPQLAIEVTGLEPRVVHGQRARLERALANVLDNACKWSPPAGAVEVALTGGEVTVLDHGPGIAPEDLPHVFDRFYRAPAARSMPGSGLGLAIVRRAIEAHGGKVSAEAAPGGGTIVRLRLPGAAPAAATVTDTPAVEPA